MRQIPSLSGFPRDLARVLEPVKENIDQLRGNVGDKIVSLESTASNDAIISKINEIITRLQG